jgi:hypothetical protein
MRQRNQASSKFQSLRKNPPNYRAAELSFQNGPLLAPFPDLGFNIQNGVFWCAFGVLLVCYWFWNIFVHVKIVKQHQPKSPQGRPKQPKNTKAAKSHTCSKHV